MQHKIEAIQLELTNACGLDCAECPRRYMTRKVGMMDFELAKLIALETLKYNYYAGFNLNGLGEPLLYSYLPEFIEYLCSLKKDVHFDLFTGLVADTEQIKIVMRVIKDSKCDVTLATLLICSGSATKPVNKSKWTSFLREHKYSINSGKYEYNKGSPKPLRLNPA